MTEKQKRFANEYIGTLNIVQAAKKAGYSQSAGYKLIKNEEIKEYIDKKLIELNEVIQSDSKRIIETITAIMENEKASNKDRLKAAEILTKITTAAAGKDNGNNTPQVIIISGEDQLED